MSNKAHDIRVPNSLLLAPIPDWAKLVWISIRSHQGRGAECFASYRAIGERLRNLNGKPMDKGQVSRAVKILKAHDFLDAGTGRNLVCTVPETVDHSSTIVDHPSTEDDPEALITHQRPLITRQRNVDHSSTTVDHPSTPSENQNIKLTSKTKKENKGRKVKEFAVDSHPYGYSQRHLDDLIALGIVDPVTGKDLEKLRQKGADIFDKLMRIDGHTTDDLDTVLDWLMHESNWWIRTGNYASATGAKLRQKKDKDGPTYFKKFLIKATNETIKKEPRATAYRTGNVPGKDRRGTPGNSKYSGLIAR